MSNVYEAIENVDLVMRAIKHMADDKRSLDPKKRYEITVKKISYLDKLITPEDLLLPEFGIEFDKKKLSLSHFVDRIEFDKDDLHWIQHIEWHGDDLTQNIIVTSAKRQDSVHVVMEFKEVSSDDLP